MVKYGMPGLFEAETVRACGQVCRDLGLSFVELNANFPQFQVQHLDAGELRRVTEEFGIFYTIHLDDDMNIADFNPRVAQAYRQTVEETVALAGEADIRLLNMHLPRGAVYTLPDRKVYFAQAYLEEYLERIRMYRDCCERWIGNSGLRICVENSGGYLDFQKKALEVLLESPVFGLTLDIGHNHCAGRMDEAFILDRRERLEHLHMHDAKLPNRDHLTLGTGDLDIPAFVALARERDATVVLETKTEAGLRQSIRWLREKGLV